MPVCYSDYAKRAGVFWAFRRILFMTADGSSVVTWGKLQWVRESTVSRSHSDDTERLSWLGQLRSLDFATVRLLARHRSERSAPLREASHATSI